CGGWYGSRKDRNVRYADDISDHLGLGRVHEYRAFDRIRGAGEEACLMTEEIVYFPQDLSNRLSCLPQRLLNRLTCSGYDLSNCLDILFYSCRDRLDDGACGLVRSRHDILP